MVCHTKPKVLQVDQQSTSDDYVFTVVQQGGAKLNFNVGGVNLDMLVDSGASVNIVDEETWSCLKEQRLKCTSMKQTKRLFAYASKEPLNIIGTFSCEVYISNRSMIICS